VFWGDIRGQVENGDGRGVLSDEPTSAGTTAAGSGGGSSGQDRGPRCVGGGRWWSPAQAAATGDTAGDGTRLRGGWHLAVAFQQNKDLLERVGVLLCVPDSPM